VPSFRTRGHGVARLWPPYACSIRRMQNKVVDGRDEPGHDEKNPSHDEDSWRLRLGYKHGAVNHAKDIYVDGVHHTNSLEGFWSLLKRSIKGTHVHVSKRHLAKYIAEFEFRWNLRGAPETMFPLLPKRLAT
jgi:transposase